MIGMCFACLWRAAHAPPLWGTEPRVAFEGVPQDLMQMM